MFSYNHLAQYCQGQKSVTLTLGVPSLFNWYPDKVTLSMDSFNNYLTIYWKKYEFVMNNLDIIVKYKDGYSDIEYSKSEVLNKKSIKNQHALECMFETLYELKRKVEKYGLHK